MKQFALYIFILLLGIGFGVFGSYLFVPEFKEELSEKIKAFKLKRVGHNDIDKGSKAEEKLVKVKTLKKKDVALTEEFTGFLKPIREAFLSIKVPGILEKVHYQEGQWIEANKALAQIEAKSLNLQLKVKRQELLIAQNQYKKIQKGSRQEEIDGLQFKIDELQTQLENAIWNSKRLNELFKKRLVPEKASQDAAAKVKSLRQLIEQSNSSLSLLEKGNRVEDIKAAKLQCDLQEVAIEVIENQINDTQLIAPFSGFLAKCDAEAGEFVTPSKVLYHLIQENQLLLEIGVPEHLFAKVALNQLVSVEINAFPGKIFKGKIYKLPLVTSQNSRLFPVEIILENKENLLKVGMLGKAQITLKTLLERYVFSINYCIPKENKKIIYLEENGICSRIEISDFLVEQGELIVPSKAIPSNQLIISGTLGLSDGDEIKIFGKSE